DDVVTTLELELLRAGQDGVVVRPPRDGEVVLVQLADLQFRRLELAGGAGGLGLRALDLQLRVVLRNENLQFRFGFLFVLRNDNAVGERSQTGGQEEGNEGQPEQTGATGL